MNQPLAQFGDILVVDDEESVVEVVTLYLKRDGFEVRVARDGRSAIEAIRNELPALLVLDLMLPGLDGLEIMRRLRNDPTSDVPVIMLTARSQETDRICIEMFQWFGRGRHNLLGQLGKPLPGRDPLEIAAGLYLHQRPAGGKFQRLPGTIGCL